MGIRTDNLMKILSENREITDILQNNSQNFVAAPLPECLETLLKEKGLSRGQVIRNSMLNPVYGQQIFSGVRTPSRDKLLDIAFGMGLTFEETDILLKQLGYPRLYPRNERDAIIIYGFLHHLSLMDINTLLYDNHLETLL